MFTDKNEKDSIKTMVKALSEKERYRRLANLGEGGMSQVDCSFDRRLFRVIAVKELKEANIREPILVQGFINEAKLIAYLDHPGIASIYDTYVDKDKPCYTMKLIDGESLTTLMSREELKKEARPVVAYLKIFVSIVETMAYAHDKGVIHLDLKPDNIMIGRYGEVTVMDWGNAILFDPGAYVKHFRNFDPAITAPEPVSTPEGVMMGTPGYLSPEQILADRDKLTVASDIFSAGIILYEMMTGTNPFQASEFSEMVRRAGTLEPPSVHQINPDVPRKLSAVCARMLQRDPQVRYGNFREVREDLVDLYTSGQAFTLRKYAPDEIVFREGEPGTFACVIVSGCIEISKEANGKRTVLARLGENEIVGELSIFTGQARTATARAIEPSVIRIMNRADVEEELEKLSPWVGSMISGLSRRFVGLNQKVLDLIERSDKRGPIVMD